MSAPGWHRVKEIFQDLLDLAPDERAKRLREVCGDDRALQTEVESLLAAHARAGSFSDWSLDESLELGSGAWALASGGRVLQPGDHLGVYEIQSLVGVGGMGAVFKARDTRLDRDVAIKVLPPIFMIDRDRLVRFEREAHLLAALNHPNIAAIYDIEEEADVRALVLEFVEGATLAERLKQSAMAISEALPLARQIAEALEAAHEKGIVHRDLKPANVKVTPGGAIKVLDFGLAKAGSPDGAQGPSGSPTLTSGRTHTGVLLGTAKYMSPEQARGQPVDKRTDIWAFGCVLYEMLTGRAVFAGETAPDHIAAVLDREPDWSALPLGTPASVRRLLRRCLEKDPRRRLHDVADARIELDEPGESAADESHTRAAAGRWFQLERRAAAPWVLTLIAVITAGLSVWVVNRPHRQAQQVRHLVLPMGTTSVEPGGLAVSPDGSKVVFAGNGRLFIRALGELAEVPLAGTEQGDTPFFSPDGQWVGFFVGGGVGKSKLKKVPVNGGAAVTLCECTPDMQGASWGSDDFIVFAPTHGSGLARIPASGGSPTTLTTLDVANGEESHRFPQVLPGARAVIFTIGTGPGDDARIVGQVLRTGERRVLVQGSASAQFAAGHLIYARRGVLYGVPFDASRLAMSGTPVRIVDGVAEDSDGAPEYSLSTEGDLMYTPGPAGFAKRTLVWVDRTGAVETVPIPPAAYSTPRLSPDGQRIAFHIEAEKNDVWVYDIARATTTRVMVGHHHLPIWTPDGKRLTFISSRPGSAGISWGPAEGDGTEESLTTRTNSQWPASWSSSQWPESWSPDGRTLAFDELDPVSGWDIWTLSLDGDRKPRLFLRTPFNEWRPQFSPDGHWLAYHSNESGRYEVYVRPFPGPGAKTQVSTGGGGLPIWRRDGRELFYRNPEGIWAVAVAAGASFSSGPPRKLFSAPPASNTATSGFDVSPDGRRILMVHEDLTLAPRQVNVILNWFDHRRAP
jgi:serine/threonine-protein kinase